jgi:phage tail-like protein
VVSSNDWLVEQLPRAMIADPFIRRFTTLIQEIATGVRKEVDDIPSFVDVHVAPEPFVRWMGQWLGLTVEPAIADPIERERRLRRLVEEVGSLFVRRGTRAGLEGLLTAITGSAAYVEDTGGVFKAGEAPANAKHAIVYLNSTGGIDEQALLQLVQAEIPVDTSFEFRIGGRSIVQDSDELRLEDLAEGDEDDEAFAMPAWATGGVEAIDAELEAAVGPATEADEAPDMPAPPAASDGQLPNLLDDARGNGAP